MSVYERDYAFLLEFFQEDYAAPKSSLHDNKIGSARKPSASRRTPTEGRWECRDCHKKNVESVRRCELCGTPRVIRHSTTVDLPDKATIDESSGHSSRLGKHRATEDYVGSKQSKYGRYYERNKQDSVPSYKVDNCLDSFDHELDEPHDKNTEQHTLDFD